MSIQFNWLHLHLHINLKGIGVLIPSSLKGIRNLLKRFDNRRLDYDYGREHVTKIPLEDFEACRKRFVSCKSLCLLRMRGFVEKETEHLIVFHNLAQSMQKYHRRCGEVMASLAHNLNARIECASFDNDNGSLMLILNDSTLWVWFQ